MARLKEKTMQSTEPYFTTSQSERQILPSARVRLIELGEAKLRLHRYRSAILGSSKVEAVSRLLDGILSLEAAETEGRP
jgi:hypothetical protein